MSKEEGLSSGFKSVQSFLRGKALPGTIRLSRREGGSSRQLGDGVLDDRPTPPPGPSSSQSQRDMQAKVSQFYHPASPQLPDHATPGSSSSGRGFGGLAAGAPPLGDGPSPVTHANGREQQPATTPDGQQGGRSSVDGSPGVGVSPGRSQNARNLSDYTRAKFQSVLGEVMIDMEALRKLCWSGIPPDLRPTCWRLLLGYLPVARDRWEVVLSSKRQEYVSMLPTHYDIDNAERSPEELCALRQVTIDAPRTAPDVALFQTDAIQRCLRRMLYIWGVRHPASGYVQGINDLATPFISVFLQEALPRGFNIWDSTEEEGAAVMAAIDEQRLLHVEADTYWCLSKLLEGIQDHYTYAQPGIQMTVFKFKELVRRTDVHLAAHLEQQGIEFLQFGFRWVNCLLLREMPLPVALRLWDTYLAEKAALKEFLVYLCCAFLRNWSRELLTFDFQQLMLYLQRLPTQRWGPADVEPILSQTYIMRTVFTGAGSHLLHLQQAQGPQQELAQRMLQ